MDGLSDDYDRWLARFASVVSRYLDSEGGTPPSAGAAEFTEPIDHAFLQCGAGADIEGMLWPAWQAVISVADTPDDGTRSRLVELLVAIRGRGILARPGGEECMVWDMRAHVDLPVFGAEMRETWNFQPPEVSAESWANFNAFAAQLTAADIDFALYGIWALRAALEEDGDEVPQVLPAAVQWLRHAGPVLASLTREGAADPHGYDQPGRLCREAGLTDPGFTIRRWNFWRDRLAVISAAGGDAAVKAREGLQYMLATGGRGA
jgi:hypothetical protein